MTISITHSFDLGNGKTQTWYAEREVDKYFDFEDVNEIRISEELNGILIGSPINISLDITDEHPLHKLHDSIWDVVNNWDWETAYEDAKVKRELGEPPFIGQCMTDMFKHFNYQG